MINQSGKIYGLAARRGSYWLLGSAMLLIAMETLAQARPLLTRHVRPAVISGQAQFLSHLPPDQTLHIDIVLPLRDQAGLEAFLQEVYNPSSPSYRHFLTVAEFTARFGPSQEDYDALVQYAKSNSLAVTGGSRDGMDVQLEGSVTNIEGALHVSMGVYQHPTENRTFYAPDREPTLDLPFPVWHVSGLENYALPKPTYMHRGSGKASNATTGSGPSSSFLGSDMRAAYYGGTVLTGSGQTVGLLEYYGYDIADLNTYFTNAKQTNNVPIDGISTDGTSLTCLSSKGCDDTEQIIDMTQALGMAPGLSALYVYVGSSDTAIFSSMSTHSPLSAQLSSSWTWSPSDPATDDPYFQKFAAQGQNLFQAAGDNGAYTSSSQDVFPANDAHVTVVGGTDLNTSGAAGHWASETVWVDGGGGYFTPDAIPIPSWQQLPGVITSANQGSTTLRNSPDVAANANFTFYVCADQTTCTANVYGGTSFAAPMWAGYLALANQQSVANTNSTLGFINPAIYQLGLGSGYDADFHDITSGNNGYPAGIGYDLATGWGSPNGSALINSFTGSSTSPYFQVSPSPASVSVERGSNGASTITAAVFNGFDSAIALSATGQPAGVTVTFNPTSFAAPGSGASTMTMAVASTTASGTYTITVTGTSGSSQDSTGVTLVVPPIAVSVTPPAATLSAGQMQQFMAMVTNTTNTAVTWSVSPNVGAISSTGLYTAPTTISALEAVTVIATSVADTTRSGSALITLIPAASWYNLSWRERKVITIDHTKVSGSSNLVNFPVLVSVTDPTLIGVAKLDGSDILFTALDGASKLAHEIETYNPSTGQLIAWVSVPTLSASVDTVLYVYYGNASAANQQNPTGVWDSNYEGVWHLANGTTLSGNDSTSNANNAVTLNGSTAAAGEIDGAASMNGSSNFIEVSNSSSLNGWSQQTVSLWMKAQTGMQTFARLIEKGANNEWTLMFINQQLTLQNLATNSVAIRTSMAVADNTWHKIDVTMDNNSKAIAIYVDGALNVSGTSATSASTTNNNLYMGEYGGGGYFYQGLMDEVRISNTLRSAAWIATEYNNESSPSTFLSEGTQQNSGAVASPAFSPAGGTYTSAQMVTISSATSGASIRYTTDGSTPTETAGTLYSTPIAVSSAMTINAIAYESGMLDSAVATAGYTITGSSWYNTAWSNRKSITITHAKVSGSSNLTNFPMLVSVTDANLKTVANGGSVGNSTGNDILFTASDGATKLAHEIETYNPGTGQLIAWVSVPTLSPSVDTVLYVYYGNASAVNQQNPTGVWNSNYEGVWHLANGATLSGNDSTSNANNAVTLNGSAAAAGEIDGAASLNGSSNFIEVANSSSLNGWSQQTVSLWMKGQTESTYTRLLEKGANDEWTLIFNGEALSLENLGSNNVAITTSMAVADNTWHKIDVTMDNNSRAIAIYVDGALNVSGTSASSASATNNNLYMGEYGAGGYFYQGLLDEVRISNTLRSAAWIATEYNNESSPSTFLSEGTQQNSGAVAAPAFSPAGGTYTSAQMVTISSATSGASIRYTTDGSTPTETAGTLYSTPIAVSSAMTINAIAYESGMIDSAVATASYSITGSSWYNIAWSNRKAITINGSQVSGTTNLVNFPVLVSLTDPNLISVAKPDGSDILFTASDGATKLAHEIETYNPGTGQLIAWVSVPALSPSANTVMYLYYGNPSAANQQNPTGVWDSNYEGVWHLPNGTTLTANDSTSNGNNAVSLNGTSAGAGEIDGAASLNGTSNYIEVSNSSSLNGWSQQTVSLWMNAAAESTYTRLIEKGANDEWTLIFNNQALSLQNLGSNSVAITTSSAVANNAWHKIDVTMNNNTKAIAIYVDGALNVSGTSASSASTTNNNLYMGEYGGGGYNYQGLLDEVRISNTVRSAAWIATEYNNESSPSTFLSEGPQQNSGAVAAPSFSPAGGTYTSAQMVTISTTTAGASIRYTTNGSTPSETAGTLYTGPVTVAGATTINAIAYESGMIDSAVSSATYTITGLSWYNTAWTNRKAITIHHARVSGASNLVNFPVLVSVTDTNLMSVANGGNVAESNGNDILFTASDGATKLAHEIESYNPGTGQVIAWVSVPALSPAVDTVLYVYYGNATAANQQNPAGVWSSNYEAVWHLPNGTTLSGTDSTSNANNAAALNGSSAAAGQIDGAASLNGTSDFIEVPNSSSLNGWSQQTVSLWVNAQTNMTNNARLIEKGANNEWTLAFNYGSINQELTLQNLGTNSPAITTSVAVADNTWHRIDATIDNNSKAIAIYVDGVLNVSGTSANSATTTNNNIYMGQYGGGGYYYHGLLDEVRISNTLLSAAWIATEYNNQSSPSTFLSEGPQQNSGQ